MFNPLGFIFGHGRKIRKLRKRWDRLREKTLKKDQSLRAHLLPKEDQVEQNLRMLEERRLNRGERARLIKELELDLAEIKGILESKPEEQPPAEQMVQKQKAQQQAY
ncbi:MAG: hypothetical protein JSV63_03330 [Candidatus Aenigmatarchaeota archaeon]|nr:MAG: hypothetical protein JSV63_03330 [Candidatus Aenigmarchaeota archaeon]